MAIQQTALARFYNGITARTGGNKPMGYSWFHVDFNPVVARSNTGSQHGSGNSLTAHEKLLVTNKRLASPIRVNLGSIHPINRVTSGVAIDVSRFSRSVSASPIGQKSVATGVASFLEKKFGLSRKDAVVRAVRNAASGIDRQGGVGDIPVAAGEKQALSGGSVWVESSMLSGNSFLAGAIGTANVAFGDFSPAGPMPEGFNILQPGQVVGAGAGGVASGPSGGGPSGGGSGLGGGAGTGVRLK